VFSNISVGWLSSAVLFSCHCLGCTSAGTSMTEMTISADCWLGNYLGTPPGLPQFLFVWLLHVAWTSYNTVLVASQEVRVLVLLRPWAQPSQNIPSTSFYWSKPVVGFISYLLLDNQWSSNSRVQNDDNLPLFLWVSNYGAIFSGQFLFGGVLRDCSQNVNQGCTHLKAWLDWRTHFQDGSLM
jgi:hypothetical protein